MHKLRLLSKQGNARGLRVVKKRLLGVNALAEIKILKEVRQTLLDERTREKEIRIAASISIVTMADAPYAISLCAQTDLETILVKETTIHDHDMMDVIKEIKGIAGALEFLHQKLERREDHQITVYCHFDIKPTNILVFRKNETDFPLGQWKLKDFGVSSISRPTREIPAGGAREDGRPCITYTVGTRARQEGGSVSSTGSQ